MDLYQVQIKLKTEAALVFLAGESIKLTNFSQQVGQKLSAPSTDIHPTFAIFVRLTSAFLAVEASSAAAWAKVELNMDRISVAVLLELPATRLALKIVEDKGLTEMASVDHKKLVIQVLVNPALIEEKMARSSRMDHKLLEAFLFHIIEFLVHTAFRC